eukprot:1666192-Rhodomonas_salina.2
MVPAKSSLRMCLRTRYRKNVTGWTWQSMCQCPASHTRKAWERGGGIPLIEPRPAWTPALPADRLGL